MAIRHAPAPRRRAGSTAPPVATRAALPPTVPVVVTRLIGRDADLAHVLGTGGRASAGHADRPRGSGQDPLAGAVAAAGGRGVRPGRDGSSWPGVATAEFGGPGGRRRAGRPRDRARGLEAALAEALRGRRVLLVLDNCEHVAAEVAYLAHWLLGKAADAHLLVTSRRCCTSPGRWCARCGRPMGTAPSCSSNAPGCPRPLARGRGRAGAHLRRARRPAARPGAGGGTGPRALAQGDRRPAQRLGSAAHRGSAHRSAAPQGCGPPASGVSSSSTTRNATSWPPCRSSPAASTWPPRRPWPGTTTSWRCWTPSPGSWTSPCSPPTSPRPERGTGCWRRSGASPPRPSAMRERARQAHAGHFLRLAEEAERGLRGATLVAAPRPDVGRARQPARRPRLRHRRRGSPAGRRHLALSLSARPLLRRAASGWSPPCPARPPRRCGRRRWSGWPRSRPTSATTRRPPGTRSASWRSRRIPAR